MARSKDVTVLQESRKNGVMVRIKEKTLGQLEDLFNKVAGVKIADILKADDPDQLKNSIMGMLTGNIPELFPPIVTEDVKNLYPSEIEELVEAFIDVNFFGVKRLAVPFMALIRQQMK